MKLYTSSQIVRAVLFSVAGTAVLACAIFFYRENKNQISNTTQIEYNEETVFEKEFVRLSLFKNRINWNSTFSFWTSFIGNVVHDHSGVTICPSKFSKTDCIKTRIDPRWTIV